MAQVELDRANIRQQEASLHAAQVNLGFTDIISPVDGTVVSRNVDVGQTVAASFQTPTLFLIAQDLTRMQVDASVSESDVGPVRVGQSAEFTVDAFPHHPFPATVSAGAAGAGHRAERRHLRRRAGRLQPRTAAQARDDRQRQNHHGRARRRAARCRCRRCAFRPTAATKPIRQEHRHADHTASLWVLDGRALREIQVVRGLDDGTSVEILSGDLKPGDQIVIDERTDATGGKKPRLAKPQMGMRHF